MKSQAMLSKNAQYSLAPVTTGSGLLWQILSQPALLSSLQALPAAALHQLIDHVGLEDAGELLAFASTTQLVDMFDDALWQSDEPGLEERFDPARFGLWLEVLLEAGAAFTAARLTEMPEDLVVLGLHHMVLVLDLDAIFEQQAMSGDGEAAYMFDKALESALSEEFDELCVISRQHRGWDAVIDVLLALDAKHHAFLRRVLERCRHMSSEHIEDNGDLYEVLTSEDMLEVDLAAEREDRRTQAGYVSPSMAVGFLRRVEVASLEELRQPTSRDPITQAYFREYTAGAAPLATRKADGGGHQRSPIVAQDTASTQQWMGLLTQAGVFSNAPPTQLIGASEATSGTVFAQALRMMHERAPALFVQRQMELQYLANVLCAGCSLEGRRFRLVEALETVAEVCQLGLAHHLSLATQADEREALQQAAALLEALHAEQLFLVGWHHMRKDGTLASRGWPGR